ncbi:MAG: hypothetical protein E7412_01980 [Ruminococcaceae bacterium]|nr:hypothetical protein [Oscillospiraceae bacterium]
MGVIIDKNADSDVFLQLKELGIKYCKSADIEYLYRPVNSHPDMQIHFFDYKTAVAAPCVFDYYRKNLPANINILKGERNPDRTYPGDCAYNVAKLGKKIVGNFQYVEPVIKKLYRDAGFEFINTKQGYTKCNMCIIDDNSVITEDKGLAKVLMEHSIDVIEIPSGTVELQYFDNGFIGGASGFLMPETIGFFGNICKNPYYEKIFSFIKKKNVDIICLLQTNIKDFGSILYFPD